MHKIIFKYCFYAFLLSSSAAFAEKKTLILAADNWCPYTCDVKLNPYQGYLVDIAKAIFEPKGYAVEYRLMPYTRAIKEARAGVVAGILGAARGDAPDFVFPNEKVGYIINSFFVRKQSAWHYTGIDSLKKIRLGIVDGYDYASEEFANYIEKNKGKVEVAVGDEPLQTNLRKVYLGRLDAAIDDVAAVTYTLKQLKIYNYFKQAGTLGKPMPIYIVFSPKNTESDHYARIVSDGVASLRKSGKLKNILAEYGMVDWELTVKKP